MRMQFLPEAVLIVLFWLALATYCAPVCSDMASPHPIRCGQESR